MPNGQVEVYSNVTWINNVPPKPTPMELTPHGAQEVHDNGKTSEYRLKRRNDALKASSTSPSGENVPKRRREASIESVEFDLIPPVQYVTQVRIPVRAQPSAPKVSAPLASAGEPSESPDTLSDDTLTPTPAPAIRPTTRSTTVRDKPSEQVPTRHEILEAHRDLTPDSLVLLAKANAPEPYKPQSYKKAMANSYRKMD